MSYFIWNLTSRCHTRPVAPVRVSSGLDRHLPSCFVLTQNIAACEDSLLSVKETLPWSPPCLPPWLLLQLLSSASRCTWRRDVLQSSASGVWDTWFSLSQTLPRLLRGFWTWPAPVRLALCSLFLFPPSCGVTWICPPLATPLHLGPVSLRVRHCRRARPAHRLQMHVMWSSAGTRISL